jgi:hypothetical protein
MISVIIAIVSVTLPCWLLLLSAITIINIPMCAGCCGTCHHIIGDYIDLVLSGFDPCPCAEDGIGSSHQIGDFSGIAGVWNAEWVPTLDLWRVYIGSFTWNDYSDEACGDLAGGTEVLCTAFIQCYLVDGEIHFRVLVTGIYDFVGQPTEPNAWAPGAMLLAANQVGFLVYYSGDARLNEAAANENGCSDGAVVSGGTATLSIPE